MKGNAWAGLSGLLFGIGLGVSGMTLPSKVLGFLDVAGDWDPSLAFVMVGAIAVYAGLSWLIRKRPSPWFRSQFAIPTRRDLDPRLIAGAALFGVGWGIGGFCPGPALVTLGAALPSAIVFTAAMIAGMVLQHATEPGTRRGSSGSAPASQAPASEPPASDAPGTAKASS